MKQTRNAITFLQAQYRAILEHAWARLSAAATLSTAHASSHFCRL